MRNIKYSGYVRYLIRRFAPRADAFVTVDPGIANLYRQNFRLSAEVVMNAPARVDNTFSPVEPDQILLIYHGAANPGRGLEKLIEMTGLLADRYTLHLMLVRDRCDYIHELKQLAERIAHGRVFFRDAVPPDQVVSTLGNFDIGTYILPQTTVNNRFALPNKFFDFINAGLAVAIGPSPEMARLTREYAVGVVADGFGAKDLATVLNNLTVEEINRMKRNAIRAGLTLNAEVEMSKLMDIYRRLLA